MINTIFYFANKNEYERARQNGEISSRTISFVTDDASNVGTIYKNGVRYSGISSIDNSTVENIIGQSVSWNGVYNDGTRIGSLVVNGNSTDVYIPTQQSGGGTTIENPYDDTEIKQQLQDAYDRLYGQLGILDQSLRDANALATQRYNELNSRLDGINTTVINYVTNMFDDTEWFDEHFGEKIAESNFGEEDVDAYLQRIGIYTKDNNGNIVKDWSSIEQDVDKINLAVNALIYGNSVGQDDVQALWSRFSQTVQDTTDGYLSQSQLSTGWAQTEQDVDDITNIVKWMYSEITQQASQNLTLNDIVSAASDNNHNGISQLRTRVTAIENGYVAEADLAAKVDQAIAGLHSEAGSNYAKTLIFNKINQNTDDISAIVSTITNDQSSASLSTKLGSLQGGVVTTTGLDQAITSLLADSNSGFHSGISTYVTQNSAGFDLIAALGGESGDTVSAAIMGAINNDQSQITIHADKINLDGSTYIKNLVVDEIKDADGNSVQTSYLIDKASEKTSCAIYNNITITDIATYSDLDLTEISVPSSVNFGDPFYLVFSHNPKYSVLDSIKVTMGSEDVTNRYVYYDYDAIWRGERGQVIIDIPQVTGDVSFSFTNPQTVSIFELSGPREMKVGDVYHTPNNDPQFLQCNDSDKYPIFDVVSPTNNVVNLVNGTFTCVYTQDLQTVTNPDTKKVYILHTTDSSLNNHYEFYKYINGSWEHEGWFSSDDDIVSVTGGYGHNLTPTFTANGVGTATVGFVSQADGGEEAELHTFQITVKDNPTEYLSSLCLRVGSGVVGSTTTIDNPGAYWKKYNSSNQTWTTTSDPSEAPNYTVSYSIDNAYQQYATISGNTITRLKQGMFKVTATLTYGGKTYTSCDWSYNLPKEFSTIDTNVSCDVDIFGNSSNDNQLVYLPQIKYGQSRYSQSQDIVQYIIDGTPTKNITYARNVLEKDTHMQYLFCSDHTNYDQRKITSTQVQSGVNWIENVSVQQEYTTGYSYAYVKFKVKEYTDAINYYTAKSGNITIDDQYENSRSGKITLTCADGSKYIITVVQSGKYGFYGMLKDKIKNVTSAYCLAPKYAWSSLNWYGDNADAFIRTNAYPDAIITPEHGCACIATSNMTGLPNAIMGTRENNFVSKLTINK